jgi:peroxiredoxin
MLKPRMLAPILDVPLVDGGQWRLAEQKPEAFTLIVFYRGYHCPVCKSYLRELERLLDDLAALGVVCIAISGDTEQRARQSVEEWGITRLAVGYGQSIESMRAWGLFVSKGRNDNEPELFGEPGIFLIRPDGTVYAEILNSMPFGRPRLDELVKSIAWVAKNDYPARGEA